MAYGMSDRVREQVSAFAGGTGAVTLPVSAVSGFKTFLSGWGASGTGEYALVLGAQWETGYGTLNAGGTTLTRTTTYDGSSGAGVAVNFSAGTLDCFGDLPADLLQHLNLREITVAAATTTDIGAVKGSQILINGGSGTISSFGTTANRRRFIRFNGAVNLTHSSPTMVLPGGAVIVTASGDTCIAASDGSGNWRVYAYQRATLVRSVGDANDTVLASDDVIATNAAFSAARTWTMPAANTVPGGKRIWFVDVAYGISTTNTLTLARAGSDVFQDVIGGSSLTSIKLGYPGESLCLESDGGIKWTVIAWNRREPFTSFEVFTSSGTFTPKAGVYRCRVQCWGGGGGSGGSNSAPHPGAGGGGAEYREDTVTVVPGTGVTVTIGAAGTAGAATPTAGGNGGQSSFGASVISNGGTGSLAVTGAAVGNAGGVGGSGGTGAFSVPGGQGCNNNSQGVGAVYSGGTGGASWGTPPAYTSQPGVEPGGGGAGNVVGNAVGLAGAKGRIVVWY